MKERESEREIERQREKERECQRQRKALDEGTSAYTYKLDSATTETAAMQWAGQVCCVSASVQKHHYHRSVPASVQKHHQYRSVQDSAHTTED